jgi:hypothetical protein
MRVDASHRQSEDESTAIDYWSAVDQLVADLSSIEAVVSIVLCGSLAKLDLVPGWSDIDLLLFLGPSGAQLHSLNQVSERVRSVSLPLGLDIVSYKEFSRTKQLGGRPYMMTYEVAHYGRLLYGPWPFDAVGYDEAARLRVEHERPLLMRAELHSWRRGWCRRDEPERDSVLWLFETTKVLLRLLQITTGPNLSAHMGARASLELLRTMHPYHSLIAQFERAVAIRANWPARGWSPGQRRAETRSMAKALHAFEP